MFTFNPLCCRSFIWLFPNTENKRIFIIIGAQFQWPILSIIAYPKHHIRNNSKTHLEKRMRDKEFGIKLTKWVCQGFGTMRMHLDNENLRPLWSKHYLIDMNWRRYEDILTMHWSTLNRLQLIIQIIILSNWILFFHENEIAIQNK